MNWEDWGEIVGDAFDKVPALIGILIFFAAIGLLAAWSARQRRAQARRRRDS